MSMTDNVNTDAQKKKIVAPETREMFGKGMSFAAKEAYKLLRTNLIFALSDTKKEYGHIIGVTSSVRGEGKSTTAINLASVLAEQGKRVLLIEGDMRLPSLRKKIKMRNKLPGLSNVLIDDSNNPNDYLQDYEVDQVISFKLLMAGAIPPNPSELLGSERMENLLGQFSKEYDYIVLDLPPVTAVTDALVATKLVDGVVLVVRNEYSDRRSLNEAIRQLQQVNGKILGFVFTCADTAVGGYRGKKYKYRSYEYK